MLEDRDYMRQGSRYGYWSATVVLILALVAVYILQKVAFSPEFTYRYLALSLDGLKQGFIWQLITFQFLHAGLFHILFNSLTIFFFGRPVEFILGRNRWLQMMFALVLPQFFDAPVVGASAGAVGLIAAFAVLNWHQRFTLILYFVPVAMTGRTLFWATAGLSFFGVLFSRGSGVAHAAHLGGALAGYTYIRWGETLRIKLMGWRTPRPRRDFDGFQNPPPYKTSRWARPRPDKPSNAMPEEFISREVDPILDKISQHGIQSLTEQERKILEAARNRMAKR
jgi:membrane associated rhomboid family serine protease